jgi:predicted nucleic acid-binding protein
LASLEKVSMGPGELEGTLELAEEEGLTFYDARHLRVAVDRKIELATEDGRLRRAAKRHVTVKSAAEL